MQLTQHFKLEEFKCKDGTGVPYDLLDNITELAYNLEIIRNYINKPIIIISGYRNPTYNKLIHGAGHSQHVEAKAADIKVEGMKTYELHKIIEELIKNKKILDGGLGLYQTWIHYDIRNTHARWNNVDN